MKCPVCERDLFLVGPTVGSSYWTHNTSDFPTPGEHAEAEEHIPQALR